MVCAQTRAPGVSVSQVARRYDVNANLVFTWLRDTRFGADEAGVEAARFLPVTIAPLDREEPSSRPCEQSDAGRIEIDLPVGLSLRVIGGYDPDALVRLLRGLSS